MLDAKRTGDEKGKELSTDLSSISFLAQRLYIEIKKY